MSLPRIVQAVNARVSLAGDESISDVKTYTDSPVVPDVAETDFSQKTANTKFVKTAVRHAVDELQKQINALEGTVLTATEDSTTAYSKPIPTSANLFKYAAIRSYGGRSLAWNQLALAVDSTNTTPYSAVRTSVSISDGVATQSMVSVTEGEALYLYGIFTSKQSVDLIAGHIYLLHLDIYPTVAGNLAVETNTRLAFSAITANTWNNVNVFWRQSASVNNGSIFTYLGTVPSASDTFQYKNYQLFDLTLMFGAGNEPSTVEEFRAIFPDDYYEYYEGEFKSAPVNKIVSADSNSVIADKNIPQAILALPGYGWSAGTAYNEIDWENKKYIQRVAQVDLSTLTFSVRATGSSHRLLSANLPSQYKPQRLTPLGWICDALVYVGSSTAITLSENIDNYQPGIYSFNDVLDETIFYIVTTDLSATAISGHMTYNLATPIETDISALIDDNTIAVESGGSLTFENTNGDSYRIPVPSSVVAMEKP